MNEKLKEEYLKVNKEPTVEELKDSLMDGAWKLRRARLSLRKKTEELREGTEELRRTLDHFQKSTSNTFDDLQYICYRPFTKIRFSSVLSVRPLKAFSFFQ